MGSFGFVLLSGTQRISPAWTIKSLFFSRLRRFAATRGGLDAPAGEIFTAMMILFQLSSGSMASAT